MKKLFMLVSFLALTMFGSKAMTEIRVLPTPKFVKQLGTNIRFGRIFAEFSSTARDEASLIVLRKYFGKNLREGKDVGKDGILVEARLIERNADLVTDIPTAVKDSVMSSDEGYFLRSGDRRIEILANTKAGIFYGVATLLQLVEKGKNGYVFPELTIADYPAMKMRGISDDISRGQISTMENFKKIIRFAAMYKMNVYMPYIENEFAFKSYPDYSKGRAPLTSEEVAELDKYGNLYHVQIIPVFETLGHMEDVLYKKQFEKYAEFPGAASINISSDSSVAFMKTLLSEIAPAFSSKYFNMAADESFDVGLGASKHLVDSVGIDEAHALYYKKLYDILKTLGKNVMMYGDIILRNQAIMSEIPKDITIVDWHYGASFDYPSIRKFRDEGFDVLASPAVWNFTGPFPNFYNSYANIRYFAQQGYKVGALGLIVSTWNDNGGVELRELNYPGYAWSAECGWNPVDPSVARFESIFFHQYFETNSELPRLVYELLSSLNNQITWYEFWRAPFLDMRDNNVPTRTESIESTMPEILSLIKEARKDVKANEDIFDIYQLVAGINKYWADRVTGVMEMRSICSDSLMTAQEKVGKIKALEKNLLNSIAGIKKEYTKIYLRTNRYPMLQLIEDRFEDQEKALKAGTDLLLAGRCDYDQLLSSRFIYYPGSRPYARGGSKVDSATFVKTIDITKLPESAELQLIGDTYCKLYINGKYVGDAKARRTLTWNVERKRVRVFSIRKFLHEGKNTFVVQSVNFDYYGSAGCNILARVGGDTVLSDGSWKVTKGIVSAGRVGAVTLVDAAPYDNGWVVSAPDFSLKLKSWIER